jgi:patatin-related protein
MPTVLGVREVDFPIEQLGLVIPGESATVIEQKEVGNGQPNWLVRRPIYVMSGHRRIISWSNFFATLDISASLPLTPSMREKELRLALVCYGGISLAVYMHGVTKEVWHLARASRRQYEDAVHAEPAGHAVVAVYRDLLAAIEAASGTRLRVFADIIAGASAGGINGIFLARAVASGESLEPLTDLWLSRADVEVLLDPDARPLSRLTKFWAVPIAWTASRTRGNTIEATVERAARPEIRAKLSQFVRARWFEPPFGGHVFSGLLLDAFAAMRAAPAGPPLVPPGHPVDLMVTVTDYAGHAELMRLNSPPVVSETEHRLIFSFRHDAGSVNQLDDGVGLAFAARATASFPGAFPPFTAREMDATLAARQDTWPQRDQFLARQLPRQHAAGVAADTLLIDGSVLANAPFRPAIAALRQRPARREVDRRFVYIDPKPGRRSVSLTRKGAKDNGDQAPGFFSTMLKALSDIPREQPIRDNVETLEGISARIRRMQLIVAAMQPEVDERIEVALGRTFFLDRPTSARLASWRATAQQKAAEAAGYSFVAYGHLKLSGITEDLARLVAELTGAQDDAARADVRAAIWAEVRARGLDRIGERRGGGSTEVIAYFRAHDLGYRIRRLRQMARKLDLLSGADALEAVTAEAMRDTIYTALSPYLDRERTDFYTGSLPTTRDAATLLDAIAAKRDLAALDTAADALIAGGLAQLPKGPRRTLLYSYLGFAFIDTVTLPLLQGEGQDEFDPIKIDRISPDDATALSGDDDVLKGTQFNSFGAFFSRAFRENDYLWGRLHAVERLIDIVVSAMPMGTSLPDEELTAIRTRAFCAVLDEEAGRLTQVEGLISDLRRRL